MGSRLKPKQLAALYDESREKIPAHQREQLLNQRLQEHVRLSYRNCEGVRELFRAAGLSPDGIKCVRDLEKLPVMTKDDLSAVQRAFPPYGRLLGVDMHRLERIYVTPAPNFCAWGPERNRALVRQFLRWGYPKSGDVVLVSYDYHMLPAGLVLTDALDMIGCSVVPAGTGQIELQVRLLYSLQPTAVFGVTSHVMTLLEKARELGYDTQRDFKLKFVYVGGERHIQKLKKTFEQEYGLVVGDNYGTGDVGPVAYGCGEGEGYHYDDDSCVVEIVDPGTGKQVGPFELGQVVVTPFSRTYPLIRFGTGDLASFTSEPCKCGRSAPRITAIRGSVEKHVRVKGRFLHLRELDRAMSKFSEVTNYQMILGLSGHRDSTTLDVEAATGCDRAALVHAINESCENVLKMRMDAIRLLSQGTLPADCQRFIDRRWD